MGIDKLTYEELIKKHGITEYIPEGVDDGWCDILDRLFSDLKAMGYKFHILQVKEKFGGLRAYLSVEHEGRDCTEVWKRIDAAEAESYKTCEICGKPGYPSQDDGFWWKTYCDEHHEESKAKQKAERERIKRGTETRSNGVTETNAG